jgi:hydroxymethylpyrimidine/phosphomethylpyrimidine kinase
MCIKNPKGMFLTPPGLELSTLFEKQLGTSFLAVGLDFLREKLPDLLTNNLEIAEGAEVSVDNSIVKVQLENHIFQALCKETRKLPNTHKFLGCLLSSAIACALAKATRKPIIIMEETQDGETTKIQYRMLGE